MLNFFFPFADKQTARKRAEKSKGLHGTIRAGAFAQARDRAEAAAEKSQGEFKFMENLKFSLNS
jgi:hypothetical protein